MPPLVRLMSLLRFVPPHRVVIGRSSPRPLLYALWVRLPLGSVTSRYTGLPTPPVQSSISQGLHKRSSLPEARFLPGPQKEAPCDLSQA